MYKEQICYSPSLAAKLFGTEMQGKTYRLTGDSKSDFYSRSDFGTDPVRNIAAFERELRAAFLGHRKDADVRAKAALSLPLLVKEAMKVEHHNKNDYNENVAKWLSDT